MLKETETQYDQGLLEKAYYSADTVRDQAGGRFRGFEGIINVLNHPLWPQRMEHRLRWDALIKENPSGIDPEIAAETQAEIEAAEKLDVEIMKETGEMSGEINAASIYSVLEAKALLDSSEE